MSKIKKYLGIDCETSGLKFNTTDPSQGYQILSIGLLAVDADTLATIDELYLEIKWNGSSNWSDDAARIHGFSKKYLDDHGIEEELAVEEIAMFIDKHFDIKYVISCLGHNVNFDICFLRALLLKYDLVFKFSHRNIDSFTMSALLLDAHDSNEMFSALGFADRTTHNALTDIKMTLKAVKIMTNLWKKYVA